MGEARRRETGTPGPKHARWKTRIDTSHAAVFGCDELHAVFFQPTKDRGVMTDSIAFNIPETPLATVATALRQKIANRARIVFVCDTRQQADQIADFAAKMLPHHRRIAYERAEAGGWGITN